ncbi:RNA 2',3'-cyclic phosphodiesterase [Paenibacillus glycinis]|uniref:RNA 2',3'-cyclic phosphodiesterase n=1 Tax=Paenibacillus glycinis TaxID=2697035 RepID=A0ABW9XQR5_9BACL|nr:RNA 2',3'-cyclic phosphodiesterase [Paenibacillus glycinis]NBD24843.1 RNA 2',3'-cyclic phosphodiesterase [Paenibacillus glycinis]
MESFIAIDFDARIVAELSQIAGCLETHAHGGRFEPPENYHLTLLYLNELEETEAAIERLDRIYLDSFELRLNRLGFFANADDHVLWVDVKRELTELRGLQQAIDQAMAGLYAPYDQAPFCPHITLAYGDAFDKEWEQMASACPVPASSFTVTSFHLYEVMRTPAGRRFRKRKTFLLDRGRSHGE